MRRIRHVQRLVLAALTIAALAWLGVTSTAQATILAVVATLSGAALGALWAGEGRHTPVTGELQHEVLRARRHGRPFSLAYVTPTGERATAAPEFLTDLVRLTDHVVTHGDDEAYVALPETGPDGAVQLLRRLEKHTGGEYHVTVASLPDDGLTLAQLQRTLRMRSKAAQVR